MTDDKTFERTARAWLEQGPAQAPQRAIDAALTTIETTPQERTLRVPRRFSRMITPLRLATAAVIVAVVLGGGFLLFGRTPPLIGTPSPAPSSTVTPSAVPTASGPSLRASSDLHGQWLIFERLNTPSDGLDSPGSNARIWAIRGDGTELHDLAPDPRQNSGSPEFVPIGVHFIEPSVVFESAGTPLEELGDGSRIWIGHGLHPGPLSIAIVQTPCDSKNLADCEEFNPAFSPDGTKLAFIQHNLITADYIVGIQDRTSDGVFTFLESTRVQQRPTNGQEAGLGRPSWSPDGKQIAYQRTLLTDNVPVASEINVVNADDTSNRLLPTPPGSTYADPHWSPDGSRILLSNHADRYDPSYLTMGIYTISPDTGVLTTLCDGRDCGANPSWTSDGSQILAWALNAANRGTWALMDAAGGEMVPINPDLDVYTTDAEGGFVVRLQSAVEQ